MNEQIEDKKIKFKNAVKISIAVISLLGGIATFFALILGPMFYLGNKMDANTIALRTEMQSLRSEIKVDMSEFRQEMREFRKTQENFNIRLCVLEDRYLRIREKE